MATRKKNARAKQKSVRLLETPTAIAAGLIARRCLRDLKRARRRLEAKRDDKALHRFRVALRRLRSTLQVYGPILGDDTVPRKLRRALKRLARATSAARDAEVGIEWLRNGRTEADAAEGVACDWLSAHWAARRDASYKDIRKKLNATFAVLDARLIKMFDAWAEVASAAALAPTVARLLTTQIAAVSAELARIRTVFDTEAIHAARIETKRLRYLLEPLVAELRNGTALRKSLKRFQDAFGELCDRQMVSDELTAVAARCATDRIAGELRSILAAPVPDRIQNDAMAAGLPALARRVRAEREQRFAAIEGRYLGGHQAEFLAPYRVLAETLAARAPGSGGTRHRRAKGRRRERAGAPR